MNPLRCLLFLALANPVLSFCQKPTIEIFWEEDEFTGRKKTMTDLIIPGSTNTIPQISFILGLVEDKEGAYLRLFSMVIGAGISNASLDDKILVKFVDEEIITLDVEEVLLNEFNRLPDIYQAGYAIKQPDPPLIEKFSKTQIKIIRLASDGATIDIRPDSADYAETCRLNFKKFYDEVLRPIID